MQTKQLPVGHVVIYLDSHNVMLLPRVGLLIAGNFIIRVR